MNTGKIKPFTCKCGKIYQIDAWTAAHWDEKLQLKCDCGRLWFVQSGKYTLVRE